MEGTRRPAVADDGTEFEEGTLEALSVAGAPDPGRLAYVALGSNLGDREDALRLAIAALGERLPVAAASGVFESAAHTLPGQPDQPAFLNAVVAVAPSLPPRAMLDALLEIEARLGRRRDGHRWEARVIDMDLVLYADRVIREEGLDVPHPRLAERRFVLAPLTELAPDVPVPGAGGTVAELLARCTDPGEVRRTDIQLLG